MIRIVKISAISVVTLLLPLLIWHASSAQSLAPAETKLSKFRGNILAASDADMLATAYADGVMNKVEGVEDTLSFVQIVNGIPQLTSKKMASNSVVSWPSIIAWNKAKKLAYVAETRGVHNGTNQQVENVWKDLPSGSLITVINYQEANDPRVIQTVAVGENIQGVTINAQGTLLVAGSTERGKEIIVIELEDGQLGQRHYFANDERTKTEDNNSGIRTIEFHPTKNIIAANLNNTHLVMYRVIIGDEAIQLEQIGPSIEVAKHWSVGNWHPEGKYFILTDVAWGEGTLGAILNGKGQLVSVRYDEAGSHQVVSTTKVGLSPEGFDVSPDGQYAIVANMRRTYGPKNFWFVPARKHASLSLVKIDQKTGELITLGRPYGFAGALPEDAIFDTESNSIAVAVFHKQDEAFPTKGWIDFWELENDALIKTQQRLDVTRGVHNLLLVE